MMIKNRRLRGVKRNRIIKSIALCAYCKNEFDIGPYIAMAEQRGRSINGIGNYPMCPECRGRKK